MRHRAVLLLTLLAWASGLLGADDDWLEIRSPHFRVISNAGEKRGREVALRFEDVRSLFARALPDARVATYRGAA